MFSQVNIAMMIATVAAIQDVTQYRISNNLTYPAILAGLIWQTSNSGWQGFAYSFLGLAIAFASLFPVFLAKGFGAGDVKLFMALGAWIGPRFVTNLLLISLSINGVVSAAILFSRHDDSRVVRWVASHAEKVFESIGLRLHRKRSNHVPLSETKPLEKVPLAVIVLIGMIAVFHFGLVIL